MFALSDSTTENDFLDGKSQWQEYSIFRFFRSFWNFEFLYISNVIWSLFYTCGSKNFFFEISPVIYLLFVKLTELKGNNTQCYLKKIFC